MEKGKQLFGAKLTAPGCIHGRKMVRKYRKRRRGQLSCTLSQQLDNNIKIYKFCTRWDLTPNGGLIVLSSYAPLKLTLNMSFFYIDYLAIWVNHIATHLSNLGARHRGLSGAQVLRKPFDLECWHEFASF